MHPRPFAIASTLLLIAAMWAPLNAIAGWPAVGTPVCIDPSDQTFTRLTGDGSGGLFLSWADGRKGNDYDVYAQHLTAEGQIAPGWPTNGEPICSGPGSQGAVWIVDDAHGGFYAAIDKYGTLDIYLQHVLANGSLAPGFTQSAMPIALAPGQQLPDAAIADGTGGIYIVWNDPPTSTVKGQHVLYDGSLAPGWPAGGRTLSSPAMNAYAPSNPQFLASDGAGGLLGVWLQQGASLQWHLYGLRFTPLGDIYPGWPVGGVPLAPAALDVSGTPITSDGAGGFYAAWEDLRSAPNPNDNSSFSYADIYVQHVLATGAIAAGWPTDGLLACGAPGGQEDPQVVGDGFGGVVLAWDDYRGHFQTGQDVWALRLNADGTRAVGWAANGNPAAVGPGYQYIGVLQRLVADGHGGAFVAYDDENLIRSFVQHVLMDGTIDPAYSALGNDVSTRGAGEMDEVVVGDGFGGLYAGWSGSGTPRGNIDIWATHIGPDVPTAIALSVLSTDAQPDRVSLTWLAPQAMRATVERREGGGGWQSLGEVTTDGEYRLAYDDRAVTPGTTYGYHLSYVDGGTLAHTVETTVLVPRAYTLALAGFRPNPATSADLAISFELPSTAAGRLELLDVTGRRIAERDLSGYAAGRYTERIADRARVAPGVYWLRLTHSGRVLTARGVVLR